MPGDDVDPSREMAAHLRYQPVDRVPDLEFSAWQQTIARWRQEGMETHGQTGGDLVDAYFGTDSADYGPGLWIAVGLLPGFEPQVLEERGTHQIVLDGDGALVEQLNPELGASIPRYIRYAIESRADWERLRDERLDPAHPERVPRYLDALVRRLRERDYPLSLYLGSIYGWIRNWVGVERLSLLLYDDRPLVEEMMEHLTRLTLSVLEQLAGRGIEVDYGALVGGHVLQPWLPALAAHVHGADGAALQAHHRLHAAGVRHAVPPVGLRRQHPPTGGAVAAGRHQRDVSHRGGAHGPVSHRSRLRDAGGPARRVR